MHEENKLYLAEREISLHRQRFTANKLAVTKLIKVNSMPLITHINLLKNTIGTPQGQIGLAPADFGAPPDIIGMPESLVGLPPSAIGLLPVVI